MNGKAALVTGLPEPTGADGGVDTGPERDPLAHPASASPSAATAMGLRAAEAGFVLSTMGRTGVTVAVPLYRFIRAVVYRIDRRRLSREGHAMMASDHPRTHRR